MASLRTLMEFVRVESDVRGKPLPCFGHDLFFRVVSAIVDNDTDVKDEVGSEAGCECRCNGWRPW